MGYRFDAPGVWAQPEETLDEGLALERDQVNPYAQPKDPKLNAILKDKSGKDCGRQPVQFLTSDDPTLLARPMVYKVDNPNFGDLLRSISACLAN